MFAKLAALGLTVLTVAQAHAADMVYNCENRSHVSVEWTGKYTLVRMDSVDVTGNTSEWGSEFPEPISSALQTNQLSKIQSTGFQEVDSGGRTPTRFTITINRDSSFTLVSLDDQGLPVMKYVNCRAGVR